MRGTRKSSRKGDVTVNSRKSEGTQGKEESEMSDTKKDKKSEGEITNSSKRNKKELSEDEDGWTTNKSTNRRVARKVASNNFEDEGPPKKLRERKEIFKSEVSEKDKGMSKNREYEVEAIVGQRKSHKRSEEFLVKWKGYDAKDNSWEPKSNLKCKRLLDDYLKAKNK